MAIMISIIESLSVSQNGRKLPLKEGRKKIN
jgi:hypothetical protein